ncbi:hypothetical protein SAMN05660653_03125 [Desulfonatronum thiosulfatophilum]|uniref:Uncharacterized protein n=1 Tax=Desulfonatronum thiosulfatophilum TaxID=617002 RepID=A0A1G6ETA7_9BACT|nr:hypothetical protein [Desulfonatronum thiosulfatophilum]SDB60656.1 hypothetical protein SAMN05660653_03125 [Desulfonatronum thiosulfatophilum]
MHTGRCVEGIGEGRTGRGMTGAIGKLMNILGGKVRFLRQSFFAARSVELFLEHKEIAVISGRRQVHVKCLEGRGWVAAEGDYTDYELGPGGEATVGGTGKVTVTGYGCAAKFVITSASSFWR